MISIGINIEMLASNFNIHALSKKIESLLWRELGHPQRPNFAGDLPRFLMRNDESGWCRLSLPMAPKELVRRLRLVQVPAPQKRTAVGIHIDVLTSLIGLTPPERKWLIWAFCAHQSRNTFLANFPIGNIADGAKVFALLLGVPEAAVCDSFRLVDFGFLTRLETKENSSLATWLSVTDQFASFLVQPYASRSDLLTALCQVHFLLPAPCQGISPRRVLS